MIWREYGSNLRGLRWAYGLLVLHVRVTETLCTNTFLRGTKEKPTVLPQWVDLMPNQFVTSLS
jgi:hypothetical protein